MNHSSYHLDPGPADPANGSGGISPRERFEELLLDRAVEGLSPEQERELLALSRSLGLEIHDGYDQAAAAVDLALTVPGRFSALPELPADLAQRVLEQGVSFVRSQTGTERAEPKVVPPLRISRSLTDGDRAGTPTTTDQPRGSAWTLVRGYGGWVAAAACLALLISQRDGGNSGRISPVAGAGSGIRTGSTNNAQLPLEGIGKAVIGQVNELVSSIFNERPEDMPVVTLYAPDDDLQSKAIGSVIWSPERQMGVLLAHGIAPIDKPGDTYQLWIVDTLRDQRFPVDGGIFSIDSPTGRDAPVAITFRPAQPIGHAAAFAVTIERAGGVVVSSSRPVAAGAVVTASRTAPGGEGSRGEGSRGEEPGSKSTPGESASQP
ncbi:MAG: anti-sigma factor domain-containing protein [Phycisphaerales bacterium]|nr:anti-sigma factor [Phycisphaeraceae bacterium]